MKMILIICFAILYLFNVSNAIENNLMDAKVLSGLNTIQVPLLQSPLNPFQLLCNYSTILQSSYLELGTSLSFLQGINLTSDLSFVPTPEDVSLSLPLNFFSGNRSYIGMQINGTNAIVSIAGQEMIVEPDSFVFGFLGLGFNRTHPFNFIQNLFRQGQIAYPAFSLAVTNSSIPTVPGYLGYMNQSAFAGAMTNYSNLPDSDGWNFSLQDIEYGNISLGTNGIVTLLSQIGNVTLVPMNIFNAVLAAASGINFTIVGSSLSSSAFFPCVQASNLQNLVFIMDNKPMIIYPDSQYSIISPTSCFFTLVGSSLSKSILMGSMINYHRYTVFDYAAKTLGSALLV